MSHTAHTSRIISLRDIQKITTKLTIAHQMPKVYKIDLWLSPKVYDKCKALCLPSKDSTLQSDDVASTARRQNLQYPKGLEHICAAHYYNAEGER